MNKFIVALVALTVLVGVFLVFNTYIYQERLDNEIIPELPERDVYLNQFQDSSVEVAFDYLDGPDGYVIDDLSAFVGEELQGIEFVKLYRIMNAKEKFELENSEGGREGPPAIQLMVFRNNLNQSASAWVDAFPAFSNIEMVLGEVDRDVVVGGANAVRYTTDGLYQTENVVVASGGYMYHFAGSYLEQRSLIHQDFREMIGSVRFLQSGGEADGSGAVVVPKIKVTEPVSSQDISNPIVLSGEAQGNWFFEATAPVTVVDWDGRIIGEGYIEAEGDWMTVDFVPFTGVVSYDLPANSYSDRGTVIFSRANASGLPEHDVAAEVPVVLR